MLSDEQRRTLVDSEMGEYWEGAYAGANEARDQLEHFARAIEAAACAERDQRIAELERRNSDLYQDVQRFKEHALNEKDARLGLEKDLIHKDDYCEQLGRELAKATAEIESARKDAERLRTFLGTRPENTHEVILQAIDAAKERT